MEYLKNKLDRPYKKVLFGALVLTTLIAIGLPSYGDFLFELQERWTGQSLINWEQLKSFCGWEARLPGESEMEFRLRSGASALSAKVGMSVISFAMLGGFYLMVKFVFWATAPKKKS